MSARPEPLRKKDDIVRVLRRGKRSHTPLFRLRALPNKTSTTRVGVIVGSSVSKKAVVRNRIRRRTREGFSRALRESAPGRDIVILPNAKAEGASFEELVASLTKALR